MRALRYFGSESGMSKALNEQGTLTREAKAAMKAAYEALSERLGSPSQAKMGQILGGFTQGGVQKAAAGTAGRQMAEAIAAKLGLDLDGMVAKYGPPFGTLAPTCPRSLASFGLRKRASAYASAK